MSINLTQFCANDDVRSYLNAPFSDSEFTYACNGHIMVMVPRIEGFADITSPMAELAPKKFADNPMHNVVKIPKLPAKVTKPCPECEHGCFECDGGWIEQMQWVGVGDSGYQAKYLRMILALPNSKFSPNGTLHPAAFIFDGGAGLLMPCREF